LAEDLHVNEENRKRILEEIERLKEQDGDAFVYIKVPEIKPLFLSI
jgi:hypothetical protein